MEKQKSIIKQNTNIKQYRYVIGELLDAIRALSYKQDERFYSGVHGDSDITDLLDWPVSLAEDFLRMTKENNHD